MASEPVSAEAYSLAVDIMFDLFPSMSSESCQTVRERWDKITRRIAPLIAERDRLLLELADAVHLRDHWFKTYQHALTQWDRTAAELAALKNNSRIPFDETKP